MRLGKLTLIAALGGVLICASAVAKPGKLLDIGKDNGFPTAFAKGTVFDPRGLLVRITADPKGPVEVTYDTNCSRRAKGKVREGEYTVNGRKLRKLKKAFKRPDDCLVNVIAGYESAGTEGRIKIEIFARGGTRGKN